ncbi:CheR family methyltransferase [Hymenobacter sp. GOD-10R]|uniref:CheR family methyltransferase n=1 Tax=Hymenobacter sp. GOD-10R TaxID=3093922 RepID=UPI002D78C7CD|nr:CheR family methyltransferase [Hymenobacter sp. GOD-10R]WRQ30576.1 CheR family methyltransferase [Hymenobacter sp. GOD-10R]
MTDFPAELSSDDEQLEQEQETITVDVTVGDLAVGPAGPRIARVRGSEDKFPIVTLGGSAGVISALESFFKALPANSGLAFVVVTHQLPSQDGELVKLLQSFTSLPVVQATDGIMVRLNHVYVNPPDKDMSLLNGRLLLFAPTRLAAQRLPIDYFLQSLARDVRDRAIAILLSGTGSDGAIGLKMVMENYGMVMVQAPDTAQYDSMPRAAIATEFVDYVLPPQEMPQTLLEYVARPVPVRSERVEAESSEKPAHALDKILALIRNQTGHDFMLYKRNTVLRRIERRMNSHQIKTYPSYVRFLQENPQEVEQLFRELLIGVTKFFRDPEAFEVLKTYLVPMLQQKPNDTTVRVWAPGCSTGEEAYTLAMVLAECLEQVDPSKYLKIQIFATDIHAESIDFARMGMYSENITADVSPERLNRFFLRTDGQYQIRKELRDLVVFAVHNVNRDAPFTKLDLLCCRNLLIYFSSELQKNLLPIFHYALNPNGLLFLGPSENLNGVHDLFTPLDMRWKISRRTESIMPLRGLTNFPFSMAHYPSSSSQTPSSSLGAMVPRRGETGQLATLVQRVLLGQYAPPAVLINPKGDILYVNGRTGKYLEPAPGLGSMNIFDMAREELNYELSTVVHKVSQQREPVRIDNVRVKTDGGYQLLRLSVRYLEEPDQLAGLLLVAFEDLPTPRKVRQGKAVAPGSELSRDAVVAALDKELQYTKNRLQMTIEEMESSLEELKSTNEELQSANEELQSTNEEAMTNKEELQSLNEELLTLNAQYESKTEELAQAANDMRNLLDSTEIAIIFLDNNMIMKRFTPRVSRIINVLPSDVGRPITHFASNLRYSTLVDDIQQVLDRLVTVETVIQTTTGAWYAMRILPYRTLDNYISGAVITFTDISHLRRLEEQQQRTASTFVEANIDGELAPVVALNRDLKVLAVSASFARTFGLNQGEAKDSSLFKLNGGAWNHPALRDQMLELLSGETNEFDNQVLEITLPELGSRRLTLAGRRTISPNNQTDYILLEVKALDLL